MTMEVKMGPSNSSYLSTIAIFLWIKIMGERATPVSLLYLNLLVTYIRTYTNYHDQSHMRILISFLFQFSSCYFPPSLTKFHVLKSLEKSYRLGMFRAWWFQRLSFYQRKYCILMIVIDTKSSWCFQRFLEHYVYSGQVGTDPIWLSSLFFMLSPGMRVFPGPPIGRAANERPRGRIRQR